MVATATISLYEQPRERSFTGLLKPWVIGPYAEALANLSTNLYPILPDCTLGTPVHWHIQPHYLMVLFVLQHLAQWLHLAAIHHQF